MRNELARFGRINHPFRFFYDFEKEIENAWAKSSDIQSFVPRVDIEENENGYHLSFDVPGVPNEDIHLEVQEGLLRVSGERKSVIENAKFREKSYGKFERSFSLPEGVDAENIEAHFENGVLSVLVPKKQAAKPKKIEVKSGKGSFFNKLLNPAAKEDRQ